MSLAVKRLSEKVKSGLVNAVKLLILRWSPGVTVAKENAGRGVAACPVTSNGTHHVREGEDRRLLRRVPVFFVWPRATGMCLQRRRMVRLASEMLAVSPSALRIG